MSHLFVIPIKRPGFRIGSPSDDRRTAIQQMDIIGGEQSRRSSTGLVGLLNQGAGRRGEAGWLGRGEAP